jgi:hypothetical protein
MTSHADLLDQGIDVTHPMHGEVVLERLSTAQAMHRKRIQNLKMDRKLITGDVWGGRTLVGNQRRITLPIGDDITQHMAGTLLPDMPRISVLPTSNQDPEAQKLADGVQQFIFAMLDATRAFETMQEWADETITGVGGLHMKADKWALDDEVPLLFEVPDSEGLLYHIGPRRTTDWVFIKHQLTAARLWWQWVAGQQIRGLVLLH